MSFPDLMAGPPPTLLPEDPAASSLASGTPAAEVVRAHPESPLAWAMLAEQKLAEQRLAEQKLAEESPADGLPGDDLEVTAYAYARVGYHRSLDQLRRNGWKGHGPVPWEHAPNRGFLRALAALAIAAGMIGELPEAERCSTFLRDSSPTAYEALLA